MSKFISAYSKHLRVSLQDFPPTKTKQQFREECDINEILRKYQETGIPPSVNDAPSHYGDFSNVDDYQTALNSVLHANASFEALSSSLRARFGNDPAQLMGFLSDPNNRDEAITLGLVQKPAEAPLEPLTAPLAESSSSKKKSQSNASD